MIDYNFMQKLNYQCITQIYIQMKKENVLKINNK